MKTKIYFLITSLCLLVPSLLSAQTFTVNYKGVDMKFKVTDKAKKEAKHIVTITGAKTLYIPGQITYKDVTYQVKSVARDPNICYAATNRKKTYSTVKVVFEEGIEEICAFAFNYLHNINTAVFPSTLKKIGNGAFLSSITDIDIPESVEYIGECAFLQFEPVATYGKYEGVFYRGTLKLPKHTLEIGKNAFTTVGKYNGRSLSDFHIKQLPEGTTYAELKSWGIQKATEEVINHFNAGDSGVVVY